MFQLSCKKDQTRTNTSINTSSQESILLNRLVLNSESLNNVLENKKISRQDVIEIYQHAIKDPRDLFLTAQNLRVKFKKNTVTFSKKAFFNVVNLCKDTCSYCTYKAEPGEEKLSLMSKQQMTEILQLAKKIQMC